jgi:hypothetical protein
MAINSDTEFNRFSISSFDFEKALEFGKEAREHPTNTIAYEALLFAGCCELLAAFLPKREGI